MRRKEDFCEAMEDGCEAMNNFFEARRIFCEAPMEDGCEAMNSFFGKENSFVRWFVCRMVRKQWRIAKRQGLFVCPIICLQDGCKAMEDSEAARTVRLSNRLFAGWLQSNGG